MMTGFWDGSGISWTTWKQSAPRSRQITTPTPHHSTFTGRTSFLTPNQQCQSIEGKTAQLQFTTTNPLSHKCSVGSGVF